MKNINESLEIIKNSKLFLEYKKNNPKIFLINAFGIIEQNEIEWELNFYNPKTKMITTFSEDDYEEEEQLSQESKPEELIVEKIKFSLGDAYELLKRESSSETVSKYITILQSKDKKPIWNFTLLTASLNVIKIKIDAVTGKIISKDKESILSFKK